MHRAVVARRAISEGWEKKDYLIFNSGYKELVALQLEVDIEAAREHYGILHGEYRAAEHKKAPRPRPNTLTVVLLTSQL